MLAKRNVARDLIASTRVDEDLYRGSLALTELWKDKRGRKREKREKRKERKGREKKRNCGRERKGGKRQEEVLALGTTRPVSKTRRAKPEGKGGRETLLPKIYGATGNTRTLLVTSWCTPRALTVLYVYIYIYIIWYKNIALFSSSFIANALSLSCPSFSRLFSLLFSRGRGKKVAWRHVTTTTIMPAPSYSPSRPPPLRRPLYSTYSTNALRHGVRACVLPRLLRHLRQTRITHSRLRPYQKSVDAYEFDNAGFSLFFFSNLSWKREG